MSDTSDTTGHTPDTPNDEEWFHTEKDGDEWRIVAVTGTGRWAGAHIMARCDRKSDAHRIVRALNSSTEDQRPPASLETNS